MKRNKIRVVCNPCTNKMAYYFKNEIGEWNVLSDSSPLSRKRYTNILFSEKVNELLTEIDKVYNRKNKGVDILFEGTTENYKLLLSTIQSSFKDRDIDCQLGTTKIAVVGKKAVGKSSLIEGLECLQGFQYSKTNRKGYSKYVDECNHAEWYEIEGIDLGKDQVEIAFKTIEKLSEKGLSAAIYCISAISGRIEEIEKELIKKLADNFVELKVMVVLTMCYKDEAQELIDEIEKITDQMKLVPVLAKEYKVGIKGDNGNSQVILPFGLEEVTSFVFEGR